MLWLTCYATQKLARIITKKLPLRAVIAQKFPSNLHPVSSKSFARTALPNLKPTYRMRLYKALCDCLS